MRTTISQFIDAIGKDVFLSELDVTERNLRHARAVGYFAAGWFVPVRRLAERHGVHCPEYLFNWKDLDKQYGTQGAIVQGSETVQRAD